MNKTHTIKKQQLNITIADQNAAFDIQQQLSKICQQVLNPQLDKLFSALSADQQIDVIDYLELDLGVLCVQNLSAELVTNTLKQMATILPKKLAVAEPVLPQPQPQQQASRQWEIVRYYLQFSAVPWWAGSIDIKALVSQLLLDDHKLFADKIMPTLANRPDEVKRFLHLLTTDECERLAVAVSAGLATQYDELYLHLLEQQPTSAKLGVGQQKALWQFLLFDAQQQSTDFSLPVIVELIKNQQFSQATACLRLLLTVQPQPQWRHMLAILNDRQLTSYYLSLNKKNKPVTEQALAAQLAGTDRISFWFEKLQPQLLQDKALDTVNFGKDEEQNEYFVNNSGLILLWPFLQNFFNAVGLHHQSPIASGLKKPESATLILHYLTYAQLPTSEQYLLLNKLLCGLPPEAVIPLSVDENNIDIERVAPEIVNLLNAVVQHMRGTTNKHSAPTQAAAWIRGLFLQREGKLSRRNGLWLLQVAAKPTDILLNKLPWAISSIKLPWMTELLMVEWSY